MIKLLAITSNLEHRNRLQLLLTNHREIQIVGTGQDVLSAFSSSDEAPQANLLLIDLAGEYSTDPRFWITLHVIFPAVKTVGITSIPVNREAVQLALYAGIYCYSSWIDVDMKLEEAIKFSLDGRRFCSSPQILAVMQKLIMELETGVFPLKLLPQEANVPATTFSKVRITLSPLERGILLYLLQRDNCVISNDELLREVWKCETSNGGTTNQVKSTIKRLRKKLKADFGSQDYLLSVRGQGYRLSAPDGWRVSILQRI